MQFLRGRGVYSSPRLTPVLLCGPVQLTSIHTGFQLMIDVRVNVWGAYITGETIVIDAGEPI